MSNNKLKFISDSNQSVNNLFNDDSYSMQKSSNVSRNFQSFNPQYMQRGSSVQPIYQPNQNSRLNSDHLNYDGSISNINMDSSRYDFYSSKHKFPSYNSLSFESISNPNNFSSNANVYANYNNRNFANKTYLNRLNEGLIDKGLTSSKSQQYLSVNFIANDKFSSKADVYSSGNNHSTSTSNDNNNSKAYLLVNPQMPVNLSYTNLRSPSLVPTNLSYNYTNSSISNSSSLLPSNNITILQQQQLEFQPKKAQAQSQEHFLGFYQTHQPLSKSCSI